MKRKITILGSTGSIGCNTLRVIEKHPQAFEIFALTANQNQQRLYQQCCQFKPRFAFISDPKKASWLQDKLQGKSIEVLSSLDDLSHVASDDEVDLVMSAIVGSSGLMPTMAALKAGKTVLLANKEALVMAGDLMMQIAHQNQATIIPVDSEHNAIFQSLPNHYKTGTTVPFMREMTLTASGGPFFDKPKLDLSKVTPLQAVNHPNWTMGAKVSVDSATLINKGLEIIEAFWLFCLNPNALKVVIHPQSIIHSMVSYLDGSTIAQLGLPDMQTPIAYALSYPERVATEVTTLDLTKVGSLDFIEPDMVRFPGLKLAFDIIQLNPQAAVIFNAANEVAVSAFLSKAIRFDQIWHCIDASLQALATNDAYDEQTLASILEKHCKVTEFARCWCGAHGI